MHSVAFLIFISLLVLNACKAFDADEDVLFKLYKRENPTNFTILTINGSHLITGDTYDPGLLTRIHIHGFLPKKEIIDRYREVYLSVGDYNFIVVDWSEGAFTLNYYWAKRRVKDVSVKLIFIKVNEENEKKLSLRDLRIETHEYRGVFIYYFKRSRRN